MVAVDRARGCAIVQLAVGVALVCGGCVETRAISFRLAAESSCTTTTATDLGRGLGPEAIARARSLRVLVRGNGDQTIRCAPIAAQRDMGGITRQLRTLISGDRSLHALPEGDDYRLVVTASTGGGCARDSAVICGSADFALPPAREPVAVRVSCYSAAGDRAQSGQKSGPPAAFRSCEALAWLPAGGAGSSATGGDGGASGDLSSGCSKDGWCRYVTPSGTFEGVWASGARDIFVVGRSGLIIHFDGARWSTMTSSTTRHLHDVWGSSTRDVYAVGDSGTVLHYDGEQWRSMDGDTGADIHAIWGGSAKTVFYAADRGRAGRLSAGRWNSTRTPTSADLEAIGGTSATNVWAAGDAGEVVHYDGNRWSEMSSDTREELRGLYAASSNEAYAVGLNAAVVRYDGRDWARVQTPASGGTHLHGVHGRTGSVYAVGRSGTILRRSGGSWRSESSGTTVELEDVWVTSDIAIAVGQSGTVLVKKR